MIAWLLAIPGARRALAIAAAIGAGLLALWGYGQAKRREGRQDAKREGLEQAVRNSEARRDVENEVRRAGDGTASAVDELRRDWSRRR